MAYWLSNGHVVDDVTWPWKVKLVTSIRLECNISKTAGNRLRSKGPPIGNGICTIKWSRDMTPEGGVRQYGRLSWRQLGFLFYVPIVSSERTACNKRLYSTISYNIKIILRYIIISVSFPSSHYRCPWAVTCSSPLLSLQRRIRRQDFK